MMGYRPENPLIIQGDHTVLVEVDGPRYEAVREQLARFAELVKSPEHVHTYRLTPLSIWNAIAAGLTADQVCSSLCEYAKYDVPGHVLAEVREYAARYGRLKLFRDGDTLRLSAADAPLAEEVWHHREAGKYLASCDGPLAFRVLPDHRGWLKQTMVKIGWPVEDQIRQRTIEMCGLLECHSWSPDQPSGGNRRKSSYGFIGSNMVTIRLHQVEEALLPQMPNVFVYQSHQWGGSVQKCPTVNAAQEAPPFRVE